MRALSRSGLGASIFLAALTFSGSAAFTSAEAAKAPRAKAAVARGVKLYAPAREKDAAIVVDGATGKVLYARNPDAIRYPASLTKMMTLYMLFEALEKGKYTLQSQFNTSVRASQQSPTKLGLQPGESLSVDTAIKAIAVLSANDVAVVIAEALGGGNETYFASLMTERAHALGMTKTRFHNASGLPDTQQLTTARDMALLGRHLAYDFPQYFRYFATPQFTYNGRTYFTHDNIIARFGGTDGIKTGFTQMSGFNLVSSVVRNNKHVVGVVMGGMTAASRDNEMIRLLTATYTAAADNPTMLADVSVPWQGGKGPANPFAPATEDTGVMVAMLDSGRKLPAPKILPAIPPAIPAVQAAPQPTIQVASVVPREKPALPQRTPAPAPASASVTTIALAAVVPTPKPSLILASASNAKETAPTTAALALATQKAAKLPVPEAVRVAVVASLQERKSAEVAQGDIAGSSFASIAPAAGSAVKHWVVQIGAYASDKLAQAQLADYRKRALDTIGKAQPLVVPFAAANGKTLYRARFSGYSETEAYTICKRMTERGQTCFAAQSD